MRLLRLLLPSTSIGPRTGRGSVRTMAVPLLVLFAGVVVGGAAGHPHAWDAGPQHCQICQVASTPLGSPPGVEDPDLSPGIQLGLRLSEQLPLPTSRPATRARPRAPPV